MSQSGVKAAGYLLTGDEWDAANGKHRKSILKIAEAVLGSLVFYADMSN